LSTFAIYCQKSGGCIQIGRKSHIFFNGLERKSAKTKIALKYVFFMCKKTVFEEKINAKQKPQTKTTASILQTKRLENWGKLKKDTNL
jgi:hypothetical protein